MGGVVDAIVSIVSDFISWLIPIPDIPEFDTPEEEKGVLVNKSSNNAQIPVIYGTRQVGITRVLMESSGADNTYLYIAGVLAEGEVNAITSISIDDKVVTFDGALTHGTVREVASSDSNFYKGSSHIQAQAFMGKDDQVASSVLSTLTNWTSAHKLSGVAYVAFRFKWNQDVFGNIPDVKVTVQGRKVFDPRTDTTAFSSNPSLCLLDYLRNDRYGKGLPDSAFETDFASFKTSATTCETQVTPYSGGSDINLFDTNAVVDTSQKVFENVKKLLNPMRAFFTYTLGHYKLQIEGTGSAVKTITSDNVVGGAKVLGERKGSKYNRVIGTFTNPSKNWQLDTISYPPADDSSLPVADRHATMVTADNGTLLEGNFEFKNITSPYQAQALCEVILRRSRNQLQVQLRLTSEFLDVSIGEIVAITYPSGGFNAKPFIVQGLTINEDLTVDIQLYEHQDNFYAWSTKSEAPTIADTTLPNPFTVQPPASVTLSDQLIQYNDGTVIVALDIQLGASPDSFVDYYQVEYKKSTETDYQIHAQGTGLNQRVLNVIDQDTYDVRVKAINNIGVSSTYVSAQRVIVGAVAPPSTVTDFSCNILGQEAHLNWEAVTDLDLAYYQIRYSTVTENAEWQNSVSLVEKVSRPATSITVPARVGSYLIKAVDKLGNFSINETIVSTNVLSIGNFNSVATQTESPSFTGAKTNITLENNTLKLTSLDSDGIYEFSAPIDIGAVHTSSATASITQFAEDPTDLFDGGRGFTLFDDATGSFDGDSVSNSNAHLEIALSNDGTTYTSFKNFVIGDYTARYYKFRLYLISKDQATTPVVSALSVSIDMEDRIQSENDIVSGAGTKTVTFTTPFKTANYAVGITGENMATGDYLVVTNKTISNFQVTFYNSSDTAISRTFDMIAKGY